jgi:hypothetical protein
MWSLMMTMMETSTVDWRLADGTCVGEPSSSGSQLVLVSAVSSCFWETFALQVLETLQLECFLLLLPKTFIRIWSTCDCWLLPLSAFYFATFSMLSSLTIELVRFCVFITWQSCPLCQLNLCLFCCVICVRFGRAVELLPIIIGLLSVASTFIKLFMFRGG